VFHDRPKYPRTAPSAKFHQNINLECLLGADPIFPFGHFSKCCGRLQSLSLSRGRRHSGYRENVDCKVFDRALTVSFVRCRVSILVDLFAVILTSPIN